MVRIPYRCLGGDAARLLGAPFPERRRDALYVRSFDGNRVFCQVWDEPLIYKELFYKIVSPSREVVFRLREDGGWASPPFYFVPGSLGELIWMHCDLRREGEISYTTRGEETWFLRLLSANYYQEVAVYSPGCGFRTLWGDFVGFDKAWEVLAFFEPPCPPAVSSSLAKEMGDGDGLRSFYSLNLDQQVVWWFRDGDGGEEYIPRVLGVCAGLRRLP